MNRIFQTNEYDALIKKIRRKRAVVIALSIVAAIVLLAVCSPTYLEILEEPVIDYKGVHPVITILLFILLFVVALFAHAAVLTPLTTSMDQECNPQKHIILNDVLNPQKNKDYIYTVDYLYFGEFDHALFYANKMIEDKRPAMRLSGLFNKARCEFFTGDFEALKQTAEQYDSEFKKLDKLSQKAQSQFEKIQKSINLMLALSQNDTEKISALSKVECWNKSKATQGFIDYLKGVSAYNLGEYKEAVYRFMHVKENCEKTFLAPLSEQYLSKINVSN